MVVGGLVAVQAAHSCLMVDTLCPSWAQVAFNNGSTGVDISAPPYPAVSFLPVADFNMYSNFTGASIMPVTDGLAFWQTGTYEVSFQAVLFNTRSCNTTASTSCENSCAAVCASACSCEAEPCAVDCITSCAPACNSTCVSTVYQDCPTPMFTVFAVLNRRFSSSDLNVVGDFNTVTPGGVLTFKGLGPLAVEKGDTLTVVIANGSGSDPVEIKLMAWSLYAKRLTPTRCGCTEEKDVA